MKRLDARRTVWVRVWIVISLLWLRPQLVHAGDDLTLKVDLEQFAHMSVEQLMAIDVMSVAGIEQPWFTTPAAMYVITGEEIRRSGHRSIAEALRLAPGMFVGRTDANSWEIGARGFNGGFSNKSLVLIDGRTVYDPLFSGTYWDIQDVLLEDIDRIEVINGPGATLWGANAVNGVINVVTRSAKHTQGFYFSAGAGTEERGFGEFRYGGQLSANSWFRVWGKYADHDDLIKSATGENAHDDWDMAHGGFRIDIEGDEGLNFTLQGEIYGSDRIGEQARQPVPNAHLTFITVTNDGRAEGGHMLMRLTQDWSDHAGWSLQSYYDHTERVNANGLEVTRDTVDIDFRHHFTLGDRNAIIWGAAIRHTSDHTEAGVAARYNPQSRSMTTFSGFVQDTLTIVPDKLFLMAGSKFEHNDVTGFEFQPSVRMWFTPDSRQTIWAGVSRPVRVPSRTEDDVIATLAIVDTGLLFGGPSSGIFVPLTLSGDDNSDAEELWAYEAGYRVKLTDRVTIDATAFFHQYDELLFVPTTIVGIYTNRGSAETYGATLNLQWQVTDNWRLVGAYSYTDVQVHGPVFPTAEGNTPHHMAQLRSYLDITEDIEFNCALYYVDKVPSAGIDHYLRLDLGLTFRPSPNVEITVWGQNLLDSSHPETSSGTEVQRAVYGQVTFRF